MEEMRTINLDKYDYRLILNALNEFRNIKIQENVDIEKTYNVCIRLNDEIEVHCKYQLIRVEKNNEGYYIISGQFTNLSNVDKMSLVQFCMKKSMETANK